MPLESVKIHHVCGGCGQELSTTSLVLGECSYCGGDRFLEVSEVLTLDHAFAEIEPANRSEA